MIKNISKKGWLWGTMMVFATIIAVSSMRFFIQENPQSGPHILVNFEANKVMFLMHAGGALMALLVGPWQFLKSIRQKYRQIHRGIGYTYIVSVVFGAIGGAYIGYTSIGAFVWGQVGFILLAILWVYTTGQALRAVLKKDFKSHQIWMGYSFALTFSAVTLRLWLPILIGSGMEFMTAYSTVAWMAWVPNLLVYKLYLLRK